MDTPLYHNICKWLARLVEGTRWENHLFAVGGCCRDEILGLDIQDIDLAVDIPNGGILLAEWLHSRKLTVGTPVYFDKYGTARLRLKAFPDDEIELVQTRREKYTDRTSRNPEVVAGSLRDDCFRRDFTVNTLYHDISRDETVDLTGQGVADIRAGVLRTPMDPDVTFDDDPVRILRCLRFAARFGWKIDPPAWRALLANIDRLSIVSRERCRAELFKMIAGPDPRRALALLAETGAAPYLMPLLAETLPHDGKPEREPGLWLRMVHAAASVPDRDPVLRMAAFLHEIGKLRTRVTDKRGVVRYPRYETIGADMVRKALRGLKAEQSVMNEIAFLVRYHQAMQGWGEAAEDMTDRELRELHQLCRTPARFERLVRLCRCLGTASPACCERALTRTRELQSEEADGFCETDTTGDKPQVRWVRGPKRRKSRSREAASRRKRRRRRPAAASSAQQDSD